MNIVYKCPSCHSNVNTNATQYLKMDLSGIHYLACCPICAKVTQVRLYYYEVLQYHHLKLEKELEQFFYN